MTQEEYLAERRRALITLDLEWIRKQVGAPNDNEILLVTLHKTRMHTKDIPVKLRLASVEWLREHGYSDMHGLPLPPKGEVPI